MKRRGVLAAGTLALLFVCHNLWPQVEFFQLENLRPGMKGVGRTCYLGSTPEEFQVEILGVMRGVGPDENAVLARLSGGSLERTGVFEGMSGSPVYIDGKLLGAVAFSFPFSKEPIAGITPITQMVQAFAETGAAGFQGPTVILKKSMLWQYRLPAPDTGPGRAGFPLTPEDIRLQPGLASFSGHALVPIATPLALGGFSGEAVRFFEPHLRSLGLSVLQGSGSSALQSGSRAKAAPLRDAVPLGPGSNIVISLIRGDIDASAGGTVTHIDGDKLYAFGHPLFSLGFAELPMHKGRAITVFPSLQSSFKILETTTPVGAIRQDRGSGVYGILGDAAKMIPLTVRMTTSRGAKKELRYEVARDRFLTPFLINLTVYNSIVSSERTLGVSTLKVKGKIHIKGQEPVEIENRFSSDSNSPVFASLAVAIPVNFLLASGHSNLEFENIDLEISSVEDDRAAVLDSVRMDRSELKAGDAVDLQILYRRTSGELVHSSYPVRIPPDVTPGPLEMLVGDGTSLMSRDAREQGEELVPRDLTQLIKLINNIRKNDRLYVRLFRKEPGAVIRGEGMPGLPPSVLSILNSDRSAGAIGSIHTSTYMEYELPPAEYVVSGSKTLSLVVLP